MRGCRRWKRKVCYGGLLLAAVLMVLLCSYLAPRQWWIPNQTDCATEIRVASNGFHTSLIVPLQTEEFDWRDRLPLTQIGDGSIRGYRYLGFGWGDREFYLNTRTVKTLQPALAFQALFLSAGSVLDVQGYTTWPTQAPGFEVKPIRLSSANYLALMQFLERSFQRNPQGQVQLVQQGYYPNSSLFQASGKYSLLNTCNTWTAEALHTAQVNTSVWTALAPAVMLNLRNGCPVATLPTLEPSTPGQWLQTLR